MRLSLTNFVPMLPSFSCTDAAEDWKHDISARNGLIKEKQQKHSLELLQILNQKLYILVTYLMLYSKPAGMFKIS